MVLRFPTVASLRQALLTQTIPPDICNQPARVCFDPQGSVWVRSSVKFGKAPLAALAKLGVTTHTRGPGEWADIACWHQLLDVERDRGGSRKWRHGPVPGCG